MTAPARAATPTRSSVGELEALRAEVQRLQAEARARDEFLAVVAHELRAPLAAILGWVELLAQRRSDEEFENGLAVIEQSACLQRKLVEDLLVMSRVAAGRMPLDIGRVELPALIDAAVDAIRPAAAARQLSIRKHAAARVGAVRGDAARLGQVISNLLVNAVKFTPERGWIEVSLQRTAGWAQIDVADSGAGISPEFLPHVFERFRQDAAASRAGGFGLGLAIAHELVALHGGEIEARSAGAGKGATFTVRLPLADEPPANAA